MFTATIHKQTVRCLENSALAKDVAYYDSTAALLYYGPGTDLGVALFHLNLTPKDVRLLAAMKIDPR